MPGVSSWLVKKESVTTAKVQCNKKGKKRHKAVQSAAFVKKACRCGFGSLLECVIPGSLIIQSNSKFHTASHMITCLPDIYYKATALSARVVGGRCDHGRWPTSACPVGLSCVLSSPQSSYGILSRAACPLAPTGKR